MLIMSINNILAFSICFKKSIPSVWITLFKKSVYTTLSEKLLLFVYILVSILYTKAL